ncbi:MAG TPA: D-alanyl-D-alanine carboxypeptidase/D-alanyl-D-alanine-endopeptidase [Gemmatimonadales bacterium]|nr:D-alanyl-D-alanine carboxypeptidase/D-alanyl-D-alanine-endopeptidase [Gemmatimonadales bacterium]
MIHARSFRRLVPALTVLFVISPLSGQSLGARLNARLDGPGLDRHLWGVAVTDLDGNLLFGRNADRLFVPASNTKLVVTATAAALLGPDFTVNTSIYGTGPVEGGELRGDLVLYGRGDPTFSLRCYNTDDQSPGACDADPSAKLRDLARQLRERGVRRIAGDLVGDGSYFDAETIHPGWEQYDLNWWYAAPVSGLGFNDNAIDITIDRADSVGRQPGIGIFPDVGYATIENRAVIGVEGSRKDFDILREPNTTRYVATGVVPSGAARQTEHAAVGDPNLFAADALRDALRDEGIVVLGRVQSTVDPFDFALARGTPALAEVTSRPLRDWLFPILNTSQNWFAEMLLKQLGRQRGGGGSWHDGLEVERRFLIDSVGIDSTAFALVDGSGLASNNLIAPRAFTQLLAFMRRHPNYEAFAAGLPRSGESGSLRRRFVGTPLEGRVVAKTGTISRVNTLSGYVERADGRVLVFSVQANHHTLSSSRMIDAIDAVVGELASP